MDTRAPHGTPSGRARSDAVGPPRNHRVFDCVHEPACRCTCPVIVAAVRDPLVIQGAFARSLSSAAGLGRTDCEHVGFNPVSSPQQQQQQPPLRQGGVGDGRCPTYKGSLARLGKRSALTARAVSPTVHTHTHTPPSPPPSLHPLSVSRASAHILQGCHGRLARGLQGSLEIEDTHHP